MRILRGLWAGWKIFAGWLGRVQTALLLAMVYHVAIGPIGLIARLFGRDLLGLRGSARPSYWTVVPRTTSIIESARQQF